MPRVHLENSLQALRKVVFLLSGSAVVHSKHWNELLHKLTFNRVIGQRPTP